MKIVKYISLLFTAVLLFSSCEKEIEVSLPPASEEIVVEAYINQAFPLFNYVVLSRTIDYFKPNLNAIPVKGAQVYITEGALNGTDTIWDAASKKQLVEIAPDSIPGIYFNFTLTGREEHVYKLEIEAEGKHIFGVASIPKLIALDSLTYEVKINPNNNKDTGKFITIHYNEPAEKGDNYRAMYRIGGDSTYFGWGSIADGDAVFNDDVINGIYRHFTYGRNFDFGDTVRYYFNTINREAYNFWDSYFQARSNGGPFATPVQLKSTVTGAIGSFTGMAVDYKQVIIKRP
jgi:hypothetical protein